MKDGYVEVSAGGTQIQLWADVYHPVVHVEITNAQPLRTEVSYENWRYKERMIRKGEGQQCSYKWAPPKGAVTTADFVSLSSKRKLPGMTKKENLLLFYHRNPEQTVFDIVVAQQGMENVKSQMMNPLKVQQIISMPVQTTVPGTFAPQKFPGRSSSVSSCTQNRRQQ